MLPMAFFLQDDHERMENDQGQLLDAIDEQTFFLKRLNSQMNMKLLLGLEMAWEMESKAGRDSSLVVLLLLHDWLI
ncbi:hypothetical protein F2Q69_00030996 [Brassica cretica]|uniref:Uncharacterized protein n=1 Tax=Brassica cretica TaxID=69181 RepID=A0A8S9S2K4_BRACR|nr:hypothetical protein F2Q69_00030996 [Brassica cretica]